MLSTKPEVHNVSQRRRRKTEMHKIGKDRAHGSGDIFADRQTDIHTDILITILPHFLRGRSNQQQTDRQTDIFGFMYTKDKLLCHL